MATGMFVESFQACLKGLLFVGTAVCLTQFSLMARARMTPCLSGRCVATIGRKRLGRRAFMGYERFQGACSYEAQTSRNRMWLGLASVCKDA